MGTKNKFSGNLCFISLVDILQILGSNTSTGVLSIESPYALTPGRITFMNGHPVNAATGTSQGIQAVYDLFGWTEGHFEFNEGSVQIGRVINHSRMEIVLDAMRMLDEGLIKRVGPPAVEGTSAKKRGDPFHEKRETGQVIKGTFVDYSLIIREEAFRDGERIVTEGSYGNWVWVILEGMVKITRETSKGPSTIVQLGEGSFIGTFASFSFRENIRNANAMAVGDVLLGLLDTLRLSGEFASISPDFRKLLLSMTGRLKKITDNAIDSSMQRDKVDELTKDKKVLIEKGSLKEEFFTIAEGETYVIGETEKGKFPFLTLEKGDAFGHLPFMNVGHEPSYASVFASKDLKVDRLNTEGLKEEYDHLSAIFKGMLGNLSDCIAVTTRAAWDL
ncbi:MAG: DUF4388 domain-containing protein [Pseudomonadota bacterium]